jgi:hypothetical protein
MEQSSARNVTFHQSFTINAPPGMSPRDIARAIDERFRRAAKDPSLALHDGNLFA